jgi:hypothetical protein
MAWSNSKKSASIIGLLAWKLLKICVKLSEKRLKTAENVG